MAGPEEWSSRRGSAERPDGGGQNSAYGWLRHFFVFPLERSAALRFLSPPVPQLRSSSHGQLSRHRRRRFHRIPPCGGARSSRAPRPHRRQPHDRQTAEPGGARPGRVSRGRPRRSGGGTSSRGRRGVRASSSGHPVSAAIGEGSDRLEPREHRCLVERAGRGARRRRETRRLRGFVVGIWRHPDAAQTRGHADQPAVALRAAEARGRAVPVNCSHGCTVSKPSPRATSTCSDRDRIRGRPTRA